MPLLFGNAQRSRQACASGTPAGPLPIALFALCAALPIAFPAFAADHGEAPLTRTDPAADIADVYAWHEGGRLVAIITFDGIRSPAHRQSGNFDEGVLYTLNIDNSGDFIPDIQVTAQFGRDDKGRWGIRVDGLPGASGPVIGPVEKKIDGGLNARVYAGLRDDPFFLDLEGFRNTLATGTLSFDGSRDTFAGSNCTAIVLEMDLAAAQAGGATLQLWATTAR
jgi:hypothetical protein